MGKEIYNIINDMAENSKAGVVKSISIFSIFQSLYDAK